MKCVYSRVALAAAAAAVMLYTMGCSSGSSTSNPGSSGSTPQAQTGTVNMIVSDAPTEDWATIGVKVLSIALIPQGGGSAVTVYTAPSSAPTINLLQLDQLNEILGSVSVPVGTYASATITVNGICRSRGHDDPFEPDSNSQHHGKRGQLDGAGDTEPGCATGGEYEPEQRSGPGV
jgi:hypothetical protein